MTYNRTVVSNHKIFIPKVNLFYCYIIEHESSNNGLIGYFECISDIQRFYLHPKTLEICTFIGFSTQKQLIYAYNDPLLKALDKSQTIHLYPILQNLDNTNDTSLFTNFTPQKNLKYYYFSERRTTKLKKLQKITNIIFSLKNVSDIQRFFYLPGTEKVRTFVGFPYSINNDASVLQSILSVATGDVYEFTSRKKLKKTVILNDVKNCRGQNSIENNFSQLSTKYDISIARKNNKLNSEENKLVIVSKDNSKIEMKNSNKSEVSIVVNKNKAKSEENKLVIVPKDNSKIEMKNSDKNEITVVKNENKEKSKENKLVIVSKGNSKLEMKKSDENEVSIVINKNKAKSEENKLVIVSKDNSKLKMKKSNESKSEESNIMLRRNLKENSDNFNSNESNTSPISYPFIQLPSINLPFKTFHPNPRLVYFFIAEINKPSLAKIIKKKERLFGVKNAADIQRFCFYPGTRNVFTFFGFDDLSQLESSFEKKSLKSRAINQAVYMYKGNCGVKNSSQTNELESGDSLSHKSNNDCEFDQRCLKNEPESDSFQSDANSSEFRIDVKQITNRNELKNESFCANKKRDNYDENYVRDNEYDAVCRVKNDDNESFHTNKQSDSDDDESFHTNKQSNDDDDESFHTNKQSNDDDDESFHADKQSNDDDDECFESDDDYDSNDEEDDDEN